MSLKRSGSWALRERGKRPRPRAKRPRLRPRLRPGGRRRTGRVAASRPVKEILFILNQDEDDALPGLYWLLSWRQLLPARTRWRLRRATGRLEEQRELVAQKRAQEQEHQRLKRLELHEHLATTAKRQRVDALGEIESSPEKTRPLGPQDPLAYLRRAGDLDLVFSCVEELLNISAVLDKESPKWEAFQKAVRWPLFRLRSGLFDLTFVKSMEAPKMGSGVFSEDEDGVLRIPASWRDFRQSQLEFALRWARSGAKYAYLTHSLC
eukprot:g6732.t1